MGESNDIQIGTVVAGRYRVLERLGEGGMGSVYRVEHVHTGQPLALKVLNPKLVENAVALERFRREARAPARINSDQVVKVTDADVAPELGGAPFLVMELLEGETFEHLLKRRGTIPPAEALGYLRQIGRALDKAHGLGIVHRDIKPENLFLTHRDDGTMCVKLLDFGIAKLGAVSGDSAASKTATGEIFGTPLYMSPEQTLGKTDKISAQTDVWALGLIAHKLLTGQEPWTAQTLPHLIAQIAYEPLPIPSQQGATFGPGYDGWFARCCAREARERYASASEAVSQLAEVLGIPESIHHSSQPSLSHFAKGSDKHLAAFAETAHATGTDPSTARSMSDTLAAQVAPKKRAPQFVYVAVIGGLLGLGVAAWLAVRSAGAPHAAQSPALPEPIPTESSEPIATASSTPPEVAPAVSETAAPTASAAPTQTASASKPVASKPSSGKPIAGSTPKPAPTPSATTPTPAPTATEKDPLSGRH